MKIVVISLIAGFMNLAAYKSFGQLIVKQIVVNQEKINSDTAQVAFSKAKSDSIPSRIYNDLPIMPKKRESANKLLREDKKVIKKGNVKRKYKHERRVEARIAKKSDKKHGIIAERKRKDRMFK
jgi:hypothetical protein